MPQDVKNPKKRFFQRSNLDLLTPKTIQATVSSAHLH